MWRRSAVTGGHVDDEPEAAVAGIVSSAAGSWGLGEEEPDGGPSSAVAGLWELPVASPRSRVITPVELADRLGLSVSAVVTGAVCLAAAVAGGWWAMRSPPGPDPEDVLPVAGAGFDPVAPLELAADPPAPILVHVAGAVAHPGVHELLLGSRVVDAVDAAGGVTASADLDRLNLAEPISDGVRLWVPSLGEDGSPDVVSSTAPGAGPGGVGAGGGRGARDAGVDVNTAGAEALQSLPGIGPSLAAAIIDDRERFGSFARIDDLDRVAGIGPSKLEQLRPFVRV